ncbi:alpha/beta-hydrolase [Tothia fuscella]|uniref:Alpha/beta-hydrolase n=1 Tax=Tothia fuscella TaxID=1048955 RepID=A0A9P4P550_9PEZI|nr:alpha/beta-hydrolase [Tothia fuscella]
MSIPLKGKNASIITNTGTITVTTRSDCAKRTAITQRLMRPFGHQLTKPGKQFPQGSPRLTPPSKVKKTCEVQERKVEDIWIYDISPKIPVLEKAGKKSAKKRSHNHRIYYFVGGGWQSPPSPSHWKFLTDMVSQLPSTTISVVSYPLAPVNAAPISFPKLLKLHKTIMSDAQRDREVLTLAGDSSGGNIVLCVTMEALRLDPDGPAPYSIMAICPSVDMRRDNPKLDDIRKRDPLLRQFFIESTASAWTHSWELDDRRVSPIRAEISSLHKAGVKTDGVTAGYDLLGPDGILFREKLDENQVEGAWLHWEKQMHCWPLAKTYGIFPESDEAFDWIVRVLKAKATFNGVQVVS